MRGILSTYGWILVTIIILLILVGFATPYGNTIMNGFFNGVDTLTTQRNKYMSSGTEHNISLENSALGECSIKDNLTKAAAGTKIELIVPASNELMCKSITVSYDGRDRTYEELSFIMPDTDVIIKPKWVPCEYTKLYFTSSSYANPIASVVNDTEFNISDRRVIIDGKTYYIVYDYSSTFGYNNDLQVSACQRGVVSKIIFGTNCKEIADFALADTTALEYVFLSDTITKIGKYAFANCTNLTTCVFGDNIRVIDDFAFNNCFALSGTLTLPKDLVKLGCSAFSNTKIDKVKMYEDVDISDYAFYNTQITENSFCDYAEEVIYDVAKLFPDKEHVF